MTTQTPGIHTAAFTIERDYAKPPAAVFKAFADPAIKRRWFAEGEGFVVDSYAMDFREGGREHCTFRTLDGTVGTNDTIYHDVVTDRRIILSYVMTWKGARISCSLATFEFAPQGAGTRLRMTEQGAYFPESDGPEGREKGWIELANALERELAR